MFRRFMLLTLAVSTMATVSCAAFVAGAGAGAGAYTYIKGELKRSYQAPFDATVSACTTALQRHNIALRERKAAGMQTRLMAKRADGTPVAVTVEMIAPNITAVGIRSGIVGYWDRNGSQMIHASIAHTLD